MDNHNHNHDHDHEHEREHRYLTAASRPLQLTLVIVLVIMAAEFVGGFLSNSLALVSDAGHMLIDALALALSLFAMSVARRPATGKRTFGYHRVEILAALANGLTIVLISLYIFWEAFRRFQQPPEVNVPIMLTVAVIGLVANLAGVFLLRGGGTSSLNIRAAFWHIIGDTISSVGVIASAIIIATTGWTVVDPIIAVVIGLIILVGAVRLIRESVDILSESVPAHINVEKVTESIKNIPGVVDIHDLHIWTLTSGVYALSAHVLITDQMVSRSSGVIKTAQESLKAKFGIAHATLQLECIRCESCPEGSICQIRRPETFEAHHH
jgi:cobalt-zinc-cadmium efflux system protein